jgi:hypothetical protein
MTMRLARSLGLAGALLMWAAPAAARHGDVVIDARRATPGLHLAVTERPGATAASTAPTYRLSASGVPRGVLFGIWTKDFGQLFQQVASGFRLNEAGVLEMMDDEGRPRRLDELVLDPGSYPRGAAWEIALVSADHSVMAVTKIFPRPIASRNGACGVSLELATRSGDRFIATTQGFEAGEALVVELHQATGMTQKRLRVPVEGRFPLDLISHGTPGADRRARYIVKGATCEVAVEYTWGEPAILSRDARQTIRREN